MRAVFILDLECNPTHSEVLWGEKVNQAHGNEARGELSKMWVRISQRQGANQPRRNSQKAKKPRGML